MSEEQPVAESPTRPKGTAEAKRTLPALTPKRFLLILVGIVTGFAFTALVGLVVLAIVAKEPPTAMQTLCANTCNDIVKMALGAIVGLVGGAAAGQGRWDDKMR